MVQPHRADGVGELRPPLLRLIPPKLNNGLGIPGAGAPFEVVCTTGSFTVPIAPEFEGGKEGLSYSCMCSLGGGSIRMLASGADVSSARITGRDTALYGVRPFTLGFLRIP